MDTQTVFQVTLASKINKPFQQNFMQVYLKQITETHIISREEEDETVALPIVIIIFTSKSVILELFS